MKERETDPGRLFQNFPSLFLPGHFSNDRYSLIKVWGRRISNADIVFTSLAIVCTSHGMDRCCS